MADNELDVRQLLKPDKQPMTLATYADLLVGGSLVLVSNADPKHLLPPIPQTIGRCGDCGAQAHGQRRRRCRC